MSAPDALRAQRLMQLAQLGHTWAGLLRAAGTPLLAIAAERWAVAVEDIAIDAAALPAWEPARKTQGGAA